jgi:hypothetical protein
MSVFETALCAAIGSMAAAIAVLWATTRENHAELERRWRKCEDDRDELRAHLARLEGLLCPNRDCPLKLHDPGNDDQTKRTGGQSAEGAD